MTIIMVTRDGSPDTHSRVLGIGSFAPRNNRLAFQLSRLGGVPLKRDGEIRR
jgi:hypothetical protein